MCCQNSITDDVAVGMQRIFDLERKPASLEDLNALIKRSHEMKGRELTILCYIGRYFIQKGAFPSLDLVAKGLGVKPSQLNQIISILESRGYVAFGKNSDIVGACGMSMSPTPHSFYFGDRPVNVWCAIDAIGIPLVLGIRAQVRSKCSHCQNKINIKIEEGDLGDYKSDIAVFVGFSSEMEGKIVKDLCPYINFFCSIDHLKEWQKNKPDIHGMSLSLPAAAELSKTIFDNLSKR